VKVPKLDKNVFQSASCVVAIVGCASFIVMYPPVLKNAAACASDAQVNDATPVIPVCPPPQAEVQVSVVADVGAVIDRLASATVNLFVEHVAARLAYASALAANIFEPTVTGGNIVDDGAEPV
jgi:hypothetical protein